MTDTQTRNRAMYSALMASNLMMWMPAIGWWWSMFSVPNSWGSIKPRG